MGATRRSEVSAIGVLIAAALVAGLLVTLLEDPGGDDVASDEPPARSTTSTTSTTSGPSTTLGPATTGATTSPPAPAGTASSDPTDPPDTTSGPDTTPETEPPATVPPAALDGITLRLEPLVTLDAPVSMVARPGTGELWVAQRAGRVVALRGGGTPTVLDLSGDTTTQGERGLLGLAFDADGDRLYVSYTDTGGDNRLDELAVSAAGAVDPASRRNLLVVEHSARSNHHGGHVLLGPDGLLYLGMGDGGGGGDPDGNAQNPGARLGKILRIDPASGAVEIHALGVRNPWRFSFDRATGEFWLGDVGQNDYEEVDRVAPGALAGANFGWDRREGAHPFQGGAAAPGDVEPVYEYRHRDGRGCSITGGFAYRGPAIPALAGAYLYGDFCEGSVRGIRVTADGTVTDDVDFGLDVEELVSFAEDAAGELYALSLGGRVWRIAVA